MFVKTETRIGKVKIINKNVYKKKKKKKEKKRKEKNYKLEDAGETCQNYS